MHLTKSSGAVYKMAFFLLTNISNPKTVEIKKIVKKFDLKESKYLISELDKVLHLFTWKSTETCHALTIDNGDLVCSIGTFIYKRLYGNLALNAIYADFINNSFKHSECVGHYSLIIKKQEKIYLYTDMLGAWKIYQSNNGIISSSFYLLLELQESLSFNAQGIYEYILNGCTFGQKTICEQITRLEADKNFVLFRNKELKSFANKDELLRQPDYHHKNIDELTEDYTERLEKLFAQYRIIPATKFRSAISGGFDSRLILSCFLKTNTTPELYVYGKPDDKDVQVAKDVSDKARLDLDFIDKSLLKTNITKDNISEIIEKNLFMYDGLSYDGIFDNGNDYFDRLNRVKNNKVLVNGSVGEVFRHFYYINNKTIGMKDFIKSFHSRFDTKSMTTSFNYADYTQVLTKEIQTTLQIDKIELNREELEKLYPLWRARYWSAGDMVNNHRFGLALYPFFETGIINGTSTIKFEHKLYGRLESQMIQLLSPKLAACKSDYGYRFDEFPPIKYKLKVKLLTYHRPIWLRKLSYALKNSKGNNLLPEYLCHDYLSQVIDVNYPYMSKYFKHEQINDIETLNRLTTVEYIAEKYSFK